LLRYKNDGPGGRSMFSKRKMSLVIAMTYLVCAIGYLGFSGQVGAQGWRTASREPAGLAPDPAVTREAVVQVYAARTVSWRGYFGVHTWIAIKPTDAEQFTVHEVIGYRLRRTGTSLVTHQRTADGYWFGNRPQLLCDLRGEGVDAIIGRIETAVQRYPYAGKYRVWPGPNSNTFTAFVLREVPELRVDLPSTAIGKDYLGLKPVAQTPSGTGVQLSLFGLAGVAVGATEGLELNVLGLNFGIDPGSLSLKLPLLGRIGPGGDAKATTLAVKESVVAVEEKVGLKKMPD
jgi:hypothetical protein